MSKLARYDLVRGAECVDCEADMMHTEVGLPCLPRIRELVALSRRRCDVGDSTRRLRERRHGRLWFGAAWEDRWSIADPADPELDDAIVRLRRGGVPSDPRDLARVLAAADAYQHLATYPLGEVAMRQLRDVRREVRRG